MIRAIEMSVTRANSSHVTPLALLILVLVLGSLRPVLCQQEDEYSKSSNPKMLPLVTSLIYSQILNLTKIFHEEIKESLGFCTWDVDADLNGAFKFSNNLDFLNNCVKELKDVTKRICTAAEMKSYFSSFMDKKSAEVQPSHVRPNINCNLTTWNPGCEPGWAATVAKDKQVDLKNSKDIPIRTEESKPCCAGFFCPKGLTCMIPCPLGSYCPLGKLNEKNGLCEPYAYQLPAGKTNHSCGAADKWSGVLSGDEIFCSSGSYCPTTTKKVQCQKGHYCRQGSTEQSACFKLSTCNPNSDTQNLHAYGVLIIGALGLVLIVFYNCSDQVLATRHDRLAKSRERAARSARESAEARQRWRMAKDAAKRHRTTGSQDQSSPDPQKPKKADDVSMMMQPVDDNKGFEVTVGDKNIKKQMPTAKQLHTKSQIFKYAYGQLEKEKALEQKQQDLTLSGVISLATTDTEKIMRPPIEVAFKDLTITLRNKNKHLMRRLTGKLCPGRISAVMGPSGAGKTTFLSAVTGKIRGCIISGEIHINGKPNSIQCYQKIVGFVPQDDIVHGNLTVEENLRFSARCRLAVDLPKADKVLIVERVIDALGLQAVRDSLVGTVEKRGISGGQRKRVNVGVEMVMEPSLLILDEPTSGLDSSSSNLLIKALRREALEGVNVCMVVHQPSYALYNMFDDLILLAKGGLTVYHGPVKKVEQYFSSFGINVPDRVNPPDHFIDILEGIFTPTNGVTPGQLPIRWMLHNGYPVPPDMLHYCEEIAAVDKGISKGTQVTVPSPDEDELGHLEHLEQQEHENDHEEVHKDHHELSPLVFFNSNDLSGRNTPGWFRQYRYFLGRSCKQRMREANLQAADFMILLLAGACLGTLSKTPGDTFGYYGYMYTVIAISLLCKISALRSFSLDKLHYKRERDSGMSSLAYFLSKDTVDHFNTLVKPVVFLSMFYSFSNPRSTFLENYIVLACLIYCVQGMAYILAIFLQAAQAQLWSVLLPVVMTLIANQGKEGKLGKSISLYCYPTWALQAFFIANAQRFSGVWLITRCAELNDYGYNVHNWTFCLVSLILCGILCRFLAYSLLIAFGKK